MRNLGAHTMHTSSSGQHQVRLLLHKPTKHLSDFQISTADNPCYHWVLAMPCATLSNCPPSTRLIRCYAETSSTLLTLELSISPDKVREISNLTRSSEKNRQLHTASHRFGTVPTDEPTPLSKDRYFYSIQTEPRRLPW